jgi:hypothetical protein
MEDRVEIFQHDDGDWYWHFVSKDEQVLAMSGHGFPTEEGCKGSFADFQRTLISGRFATVTLRRT